MTTTRGPLTGAELAAVLDPNSDILDEVVSVEQGAIVWAMATEIEMHRSAAAPAMLRAARLYTDEMGALRKRVAELEALDEAARRAVDALHGMQVETMLPDVWRALSDERRLELMALCCRGCGGLDTGCQCWNDE